MKTNLRKEQEKLAVLLEISDTPKKNSDIIKGAESRLVMDEAYTRLLSDKKTTAGKKELQFILYFLKKDALVDVRCFHQGKSVKIVYWKYSLKSTVFVETQRRCCSIVK